MYSQQREIPSNTIAKTIGHRPTKPQQILTSSQPRRRTTHHRPSLPYSKSPQSKNLSASPSYLFDAALERISSSEKTLSSTLFGSEEITNNVNNSLNNGESTSSIESYLDSFPAGYRFCPLDEELVVYYLKRKVMKETLPPNRINEINIYQYNPEQLAEMYKRHGETEMYFFSPRDRKYPNGSRPNRAAGDGYWKATGVDKPIAFKGDVVGFRRSLVFYRGRSPNEDKTNWIMREYTVNNPPPPHSELSSNHMRLDDWVLCRIYKKVYKSLKARRGSNKTMNLDGEDDVVGDSRGSADAHTECIDQLPHSLTTETPQFSDSTLPSNMADRDQVFQASNVNCSTGMWIAAESASTYKYLTKELVEDDIWSNLSYQENCDFKQNFDFFN